MPHPNSRSRWPHAGIVLASLAVAGMTALGSILAHNQVRQIENSVREGVLERARERVLPRLDARLAELERAALEEIEALLERPLERQREGLLVLEHGHPWIATPVILDEAGQLLYPALPEPFDAPGADLEEIPPDDLQRARQLLHRRAPERQVIAALRGVHRRRDLEPRWRLRALANLGSFQLRQGHAAEAADSFEQLFAEFPGILATAHSPGLLDLVLVRVDALLGAARPALARGVLIATLEGLVTAAEGPRDIDGEAHFLASLSALPESLAEASADAFADPALGELRRRAEIRLDHARVARRLGARLVALAVATPPPGGPDPGRELLQLEEARHLLAWRRTGPEAPAPRTVGALWYPDRLLETVAAQLAAERPPRFQLLTAETDPGERPGLALPPPLSHVRIEAEPRSWRQLLRERKRPLRIAQILIPALGAGMLLALFLLHRSMMRLRALSRLKTDFVANVSHELKTPLALIRMFGETLSLGRIREEEKKAEYYGIITRESERLTHLINNVLDFASIEAGRKTYDFQAVDVTRIVDDTVAAYRFQLDQKGFRVHWEPPAGSLVLEADPDAVAQALINLLHNAAKYSGEHREITVSVEARGEEIAISVRDRGVGISREDRRHIFDDFYRARSAQALGQRGTGLGLSLVRHIVEAHDGRIELESQPDAGSTFTLIFPRGDLAAPSPGVES